MAQSELTEPIATATILIDADVSRVRRKIKRVLTEAQEANRELAALEDRLGTLGSRLRQYGIDLEVQ